MLFKYETKRLFFQLLSPGDAHLVLDFYNRDRELFEKYETQRLPNFYTIGYQQKVLKLEYDYAFKMRAIRFYVFEKNNPDKIIGTVCFHNIAQNFYRSCELGYKFNSQYHRLGYATEVLEKCLSILFYELHMHRINAYVCVDNQPSLNLLNKLGFVEEGLCREYLLLHGRWSDHYLLSLLDSDWIS